MKANIIDILSVVDDSTPNEFYKYIGKLIESSQKKFVVTANPEIIMLAKYNKEMYEIVTQKAVIIPDGIGVVKAMNLIGKNAVRNTGVELVDFLLKEAEKKSLKVFIYGSKQENLDKLREKYANISFSGLYNGYDYKQDEILQYIKEHDADIYLAALGTPRQELFINSFYDKLDKGIYVGVGGSIDVLSGSVKRAPEFFLNHNLEWLYRISKEPKRIGRFIKGNIVFIFVYIKDYFTTKILKQSRVSI